MAEKKEPDPQKLEVLRQLPAEILRQLTREEVDAFLGDDPWPDSLQVKLKDYLA